LTCQAIIGKDNRQSPIGPMPANRTSKKAIKRESIIQAAIEVFSKKDFQGASITEIAQRAGVAEGSIYKYFKNKEDLFFSIPIEKTKEFRTQLGLHLEGISGAFNKIRKFVWYFLYFFTVNPEYGRTLMLEMRVSKSFVRTTTYDFLKKSVGHVLEIIEEGQKEGVIRNDTDVYILRHLVLGTLEHMVSRWLLKDGKYDLLEHHQEVSRLIIDALRNPASPKKPRRPSRRRVRKADQHRSA
jgi:TetR/AcrR family fatty acid metabolism transcriptional regulator